MILPTDADAVNTGMNKVQTVRMDKAMTGNATIMRVNFDFFDFLLAIV